MNQLLIVICEGWEHDYKVSKVKRYSLLTSESSVMAKILVTFCPILFADCNLKKKRKILNTSGELFQLLSPFQASAQNRLWEGRSRQREAVICWSAGLSGTCCCLATQFVPRAIRPQTVTSSGQFFKVNSTSCQKSLTVTSIHRKTIPWLVGQCKDWL